MESSRLNRFSGFRGLTNKGFEYRYSFPIRTRCPLLSTRGQTNREEIVPMNIMTPPDALPSSECDTPLTLAAVCQAIDEDPGLSKARKSNLRSAIICFCRACNLSPADASASLAWVVEKAGRHCHINQLAGK